MHTVIILHAGLEVALPASHKTSQQIWLLNPDTVMAMSGTARASLGQLLALNWLVKGRVSNNAWSPNIIPMGPASTLSGHNVDTDCSSATPLRKFYLDSYAAGRVMQEKHMDSYQARLPQSPDRIKYSIAVYLHLLVGSRSLQKRHPGAPTSVKWMAVWGPAVNETSELVRYQCTQYIYIHIHSSIHPCIHTYIHTYSCMYMSTYACTYIL